VYWFKVIVKRSRIDETGKWNSRESVGNEEYICIDMDRFSKDDLNSYKSFNASSPISPRTGSHVTPLSLTTTQSQQTIQSNSQTIQSNNQSQQSTAIRKEIGLINSNVIRLEDTKQIFSEEMEDKKQMVLKLTFNKQTWKVISDDNNLVVLILSLSKTLLNVFVDFSVPTLSNFGCGLEFVLPQLSYSKSSSTQLTQTSQQLQSSLDIHWFPNYCYSVSNKIVKHDGFQYFILPFEVCCLIYCFGN
jgi:hypothetical protein